MMRGMRSGGGYYGGPRYGGPRMMPDPSPSSLSGGGDYHSVHGGHRKMAPVLPPLTHFDQSSQQGDTGGFQRVYPAPDDRALAEALLQRNQDLTPTAGDQANVSALLTKVYSILESLILNPASFEPAQIEEAQQVGSYKNQTMLAGRNIADIVVVLKTLPTKEAVNALANKILTDYRTVGKSEWITAQLTPDGFDVMTRSASLRCLIATIPSNLRLLDDSLHVPTRELVQQHLAAIRHVKWFDENANNTSVRALVRIVRDMRYRFPGFTALNSWMIELLAHHAINRSSSDAPLALAPAFRRCLQLLAGGIFLPGAAGINDPCESGAGGVAVSVHDKLSPEEMDRICFTAQTLLRVNSHGGSKHVLGLVGDGQSLATDISVWGNIVVTASEAAFDRTEVDRWEQEDAALAVANAAAAATTENGSCSNAAKSKTTGGDGTIEQGKTDGDSSCVKSKSAEGETAETTGTMDQDK